MIENDKEYKMLVSCNAIVASSLLFAVSGLNKPELKLIKHVEGWKTKGGNRNKLWYKCWKYHSCDDKHSEKLGEYPRGYEENHENKRKGGATRTGSTQFGCIT